MSPGATWTPNCQQVSENAPIDPASVLSRCRYSLAVNKLRPALRRRPILDDCAKFSHLGSRGTRSFR
jgi:hypothetical protein